MRILKFLVVTVAVVVLLLLVSASILVAMMINMPGKNFSGNPAELTASEIALKERLYKNLDILTTQIGERNSRKYDKLNQASDFIEKELASYGYEVETQSYEIDGLEFKNLEATLSGTTKPKELIVVGAHYDTVPNSPGADDNGTGVVSVLELARVLKDRKLERTIKFVAFTNEEYPFFYSNNMGSQIYAKRSFEQKENILGMIAIEMIGYYSKKEKSQIYPIDTLGVYPDRGDFVFFVGNLNSRDFLTRSIGAFRKETHVPSYGIAAIDYFDDISRSDNKSFWDYGYPGFMITDTANFRNPNYHRPTDTIDKIDFDNMVRVVSGIKRMLIELAGEVSS